MPKKEVYIKTYKQEKQYTSSYKLDGSTGYIDLNSSSVLNFGLTATLECWVNLDTSGNHKLISKWTPTMASQSYMLDIETNFARMIIRNASGIVIANSNPVTIPVGIWTHIAGTYDGSAVRLYINGVLVASVSTTGAIQTTTTQVRFGNEFALYLNGKIQEVRLWNLARTATEIQESRNLRLVGRELGLVAYYRLVDNIFDSGPNFVNATAFGSVVTNPANAPIYLRNYKGFTTDYSLNSINSNVNSGYGDLTFDLPRKFDDFGLNSLVGLDGYELDVIVYDTNQITGQILFSGEIIQDNITLAGNEQLSITASAPIWRLESTPLVSASSQYTITYTNTELGAIFRSIIDLYNAQQNFNQIKYTTTSIQNTGISRTINFNNATCLDALKSIYKMTNTDWVWFIDVDRTIYLKQLSSTPNHYFFVGKDIVSIKRKRDKTKIVNNLLFWNGETGGASISRQYRNNASIDSYGILSKKIRDNRYGDNNSINSLGAREVNINANPNVEVEITILDDSAGGYDLETIRIGDTCKILNIGTDTGLGGNMVITSKQDRLDYCVLTISDKETFINRELFNLKKDQEQVNYEDGPSTYTLA